MWSRDYSQTKEQVKLLIAQFVVLIICISYMDYVYFVNIRPDEKAKNTFLQTNCFLMNKAVSEKGNVLHRYRADFLISYKVNDLQYSRWVSGNGLDYSFSSDGDQQRDLFNKYDLGGTYPCWYNPENPQVAILVMRHNWSSTLPLIVPSIVGVITLAYFIKTLFTLLSRARVKTREIREKRKNRKK